jgi:hypothetical protein
VLYRVNSDDTIEVLTRDGHEPVEAHRIWVDVREARLREITVPPCPDGEMFFSREGGNIVFGTNLFEVAREAKRLVPMHDGRASFARHGGAAVGQTPVEGVGRLPTAMTYDGALRAVEMPGDLASWADRGYEGFRDTLINGIEATVKVVREPVALLLSGGVDSTLLGLVLRHLGVDFRTYTMYSAPATRGSEEDRVRAAATAARFGWRHRAVELDWTSVEPSALSAGVREMPAAAHLFVAFDLMAAAAAADGCHAIVAGQNVDNLYNLGATSRLGLDRAGITSVVRRWFHSEPYVRAVLRQDAHSIQAAIYRAGGDVAAALYSKLCGERHRAPRTGMDLVAGFNHSTDYLPFPLASRDVPEDPEGLEPPDVRAALISGRVREYLVSGASQVVFAAARRHGLRGSLPYATEEMVRGFGRIALGWKDVASPKRFVYRLARELNGGRMPTTKIRPSNSGRLPDYHEWVDVFLSASPLGKAIRRSSGSEAWTRSTRAQGLNYALSCYWWDEVARILAEPLP